MISNGMFDFWDKFELRKVKKLKGKNQDQNDANENENTNNEQMKPLTIAQLQSAYYSFVIGICASFLSFIFETVVKILYI